MLIQEIWLTNWDHKNPAASTLIVRVRVLEPSLLLMWFTSPIGVFISISTQDHPKLQRCQGQKQAMAMVQNLAAQQIKLLFFPKNQAMVGSPSRFKWYTFAEIQQQKHHGIIMALQSAPTEIPGSNYTGTLFRMWRWRKIHLDWFRGWPRPSGPYILGG